MSAYLRKRTISRLSRQVRLVSKLDMHCNKQHLYSIGSSAGPRSEIQGIETQRPGSRHCGAPPPFLHSDREFLRALPAGPLALACSEAVFVIACLCTGLAAGAEGDGVCADATAAATVSDRTVAQNLIDRMTPPL